MPIFEYRCRKCDTEFERLVRSRNGRGKPACPECGSKRTDKLLSMFAARSSSRDGQTTPLSGKSCATCAATSCRSCK